MNIIELAEQVGAVQNVLAMGRHDGVLFTETELEKFVELVAAHERDFIATKWENLYGYDKQGVAEFIRKRANTQEETT